METTQVAVSVQNSEVSGFEPKGGGSGEVKIAESVIPNSIVRKTDKTAYTPISELVPGALE